MEQLLNLYAKHRSTLLFVAGSVIILTGYLLYRSDPLVKIWETAPGTLQANAENSNSANQLSDLFHSKHSSCSHCDDAAITEFVKAAFPAITSVNFANYDQKQIENAQYFTKRGFYSYYKAMDTAGLSKEAFNEKHLLVKGQLICIVRIKPHEIEDDIKGKSVDIVANLTYQIAADSVSEQLQKISIFTIDKRQEDASYTDTLGIRSWVAIPIAASDVEKLCPVR